MEEKSLLKRDNTRQILLIIACWLVYTASYLGKYCYSCNLNGIMEYYKVSHADAGLVSTMFFFAYGAGQIINGILCRKYNARFVITFSLLVSAAINLAVFFLPSFFTLKYLWLLNGFSLSFLWAVLSTVLSRCLSDENLKKAVVIMSISTPAGTFLAYLLGALFTKVNFFNLSFLVGAAALFAIGALWFFSYGKLTSGKTYGKSGEIADKNGEMATAEVLHTDENYSAEKRNAMITLVFLGVFAVINNLVKDGLSTWMPSVLKEKYELSESGSIALSLALPFLSVFGAFVATRVNDKTKNFVFTSVIFFAVSALLMPIIIWGDLGGFVLPLCVFALIALLMTAVNSVVTTMAPMYMRNFFFSGTLAGALNGCCYLGSTISSYGLGKIADDLSWNAVFIIIFAFCIAAVVLGGAYFVRKKAKKS